MSPTNHRADPDVEILIVEDSPTQALRLQHILEQEGYSVTRAANGRLALEAAQQRKPELIISDVVMPEMDGYELCRCVKADASLGDVPVILVTTLSDPGDVIRGLECRADNFILKPYDKQYLVSRVQAVLMNRAMRKPEPIGLAVEIFFNGQRHLITADRLQILNLLLSTYDAAIQRNKDLTRVQEELAARGNVLAQRERQLHEAKVFLEDLIAASPSIIFHLEPLEDDFVVTYVSPNIGWALGYGSEEIIGVPRFWTDIVHPDDRETARVAFRAALEGMTAQIEQETRWRAKDAGYLWFLIRGRVEYDDQGAPVTILCHALDITDRKRADEEIKRAERFLDSIVENVPNTIFVKDARELRFVRLNRAAENLIGRSRSELLGKTDYDLFPRAQADRFSLNDREALAGGTLVDIPDETVQTHGRGVRSLHTRKLPIVDEHGVPQYLLGISEDITERKAGEQALADAKLEAERANHAKSDFVSRMSHDLRTPLNAILGFAQLLEMDELTAEQRDNVHHIRRGGAHLLDLINEVLDIARIESGHLSLSLEPVAIVELLQHAIDLIRPMAAQRRITVQDDAISTSGLRHVLLADRSRLNQILLNLLSNAVKYNADAGRVFVTCEEIPGGRLRIKVRDTGAGIAPDKLNLLFQPFERLGADQTAIEGTGLGLMVSKGLAEAMGGTLGVESRVDHGSTFWVELPLSEAQGEIAVQPVEGHSAARSSDSGATGTVLYIEDNPSNRRLMERLLSRRPGVRLIGASNGQAGLDLACADRPDLILLDLHLPDMRGEDVLRRLSEEPRTRVIPVAVLSADATPAQARNLLAAGAAAYLTKPLNVDDVLRLLDEHLT